MLDCNDQMEILELKNQKQKMNKTLLRMEIAIGITSLVAFLLQIFLICAIDIPDAARATILLFSTLLFVIIALVLLKIEQIAGYYKCPKCGHAHVPSYNAVLWAPHIGRTRYMLCPGCKQKSWHKKVITEETKE